MFKAIARPLAAAVLASSFAVAAHAGPVTYRFTGTIDETSIAIPGIPVGTSFSGSFTYDPSGPSLGGGMYDAVNTVDGTVAGLTYVSTTQPGIRDLIVTNGPQDRFNIDTYNFTISSPYNTGPSIGNLAAYYLNFLLEDNTGNAFSDTSIPDTLSLSSFTSARFAFSWLRQNDLSQQFAAGSLSSLELVDSSMAVPEPSTGALGLVGAAAMTLVMRRRRVPGT